MIGYQEAVKQGKEIIITYKHSEFGWKIGRLCRLVEPIYGKETLKHFADDIGINYVTLRGFASMFNRWETKQHKPESTAVARALAAHPKREEIIKDHPHITVEEAREATRVFKQSVKRIGINSSYTKGIEEKELISKMCNVIDKMFTPEDKICQLIDRLIKQNQAHSNSISKLLKSIYELEKRITTQKVRINKFQ
jgi:hypothetical protein